MKIEQGTIISGTREELLSKLKEGEKQGFITYQTRNSLPNGEFKFITSNVANLKCIKKVKNSSGQQFSLRCIGGTLYQENYDPITFGISTDQRSLSVPLEIWEGVRPATTYKIVVLNNVVVTMIEDVI